MSTAIKEHLPKSPNYYRPHIHALTTLRFFASFAIFILHARNHDLISDQVLSGFDLSQSVTFFFVLSGFIISYAYSGRSFKSLDFYKSRIARVWPAFFLSTAFVLVLLPRSLYLPAFDNFWHSLIVFFITALGLQAWVPIPSIFFGFNAVTWSISVELFFYFCFPFLNRVRTIGIFSLLSISILYSVVAAHILTVSELPSFSPARLNQIVSDGFIYINPLFRLPEFLLGVVAFRIFDSRTFKVFNGCLHRFLPPNLTNVSNALFAFSGATFSYLAFQSLELGTDLPYTLIFNRYLASINFCFLLFAVAFCQGFVGRLFSWPPFVFLGEISFGVYLYHQPLLILAVQGDGLKFAGTQILPQNLPVIFLVTIVLASLSYLYFERPLYSILRSK